MQTPLETNNLALAIALFLGGVRPFKEDHFAVVAYDEELLEQNHCPDIPTAMARDVKGSMKCFFRPEDAEKMEFLQAVWDQEKRAIAQNQPTKVEASAEDIVRIIARALHCRKQLTQDWKELPIYAYLRKKGEPEVTDGEDGQTIRLPGYVMVNIRASDKIKQHLGLIP